MRRLRRNIAVTSFLLLPAIFAVAQRRPGALVDNVNQFARSSGYIFSGTVLKIQRTTAGQNAVAFTQITFRVDEAIQGVRSRKIFTIREWSGLWDSGERYRPGERVLLFLYPVSKLGFTSPVGGPLGRFAVDHAGKSTSTARSASLCLPTAHIRSLPEDPASALESLPMQSCML